MRAAVLSVGTELLFGQVVNTNTVYLSQQLNAMGFDVMYHYTVGDNPERLKEIIELAFKDCDLIITTGGLGPTQDDLTKEIVCETMGDELVLHQKSLEALEAVMTKRGRKMTENNYKQAWLPSKAEVFDNDQGTAPGFALEIDGKTAICLPGPPREMTNMFIKKAKPYLESKSEEVIYYRQIRTFGIGESQLETELLPLIDAQTDPTIATYAKEGEACVRVASKRKTLQEAEQAVDDMTSKVQELVGEYIYSLDDEELYQVAGRRLLENNISISCAESCTGGLFAKTLTDIEGISAVFDRGIVTYSNRAKIEELGVSPETLDRYGAVSEQTAREMALGLQKVSGSRLCISVTGIAGPGGGTDEKPVGLVYIGIVFDDKVEVRKIHAFRPLRSLVRNMAVLNMFDMVNKIVSCK